MRILLLRKWGCEALKSLRESWSRDIMARAGLDFVSKLMGADIQKTVTGVTMFDDLIYGCNRHV